MVHYDIPVLHMRILELVVFLVPVFLEVFKIQLLVHVLVVDMMDVVFVLEVEIY